MIYDYTRINRKDTIYMTEDSVPKVKEKLNPYYFYSAHPIREGIHAGMRKKMSKLDLLSDRLFEVKKSINKALLERGYDVDYNDFAISPQMKKQLAVNYNYKYEEEPKRKTIREYMQEKKPIMSTIKYILGRGNKDKGTHQR